MCERRMKITGMSSNKFTIDVRRLLRANPEIQTSTALGQSLHSDADLLHAVFEVM